MAAPVPQFLPSKSKLRLGFVPLSDCAPIAVAQEMGIFKARGLDVELSRELAGPACANKLIYGHLDAAQSIAWHRHRTGAGDQ
jgi:ABC-type nitrate/sulfonate/bicarbonate transport system substrate-binding protein